jgi:hypothetical protein
MGKDAQNSGQKPERRVAFAFWQRVLKSHDKENGEMTFKRLTLPILLVLLLSLSPATLGSVGLLQQEAKKPLPNDGQDSGFWKQLPGAIPFGDEDRLASSLQNSGFLTNVRDIRFDGVTVTVSGNLITMHNLRALSDTTRLEDYLAVDFLMNLDPLNLIPVSLEIAPNLGIFYRPEGFFSKDVPANIFMRTNTGNTLGPDQIYTITAGRGDEFTMSLESGTVVSLLTLGPSDDYELQIDRPDGRPYERSLFRAGSRWTLLGRSILQSGVYRFRFIPQNVSRVTLQFGFTNNNRMPLRSVASGSGIFVSLNGWGYEYAKYRLQLNTGDLVEVTACSDEDIWLWLLDSNSRVIGAAGDCGEIFTRVPRAGTYYLFVQNQDHAEGSSYNGTVTITPDPNRSLYPVLNPIPRQFANVGMFFTLQLSASNAPTRYRATGLPPNISIDETRGLISGIPTISGTFPIRVAAENRFGSDQKDFFLTIR